uniref:Uncharacterized protein n=1 Tax=Trypanosoma vivax (strain Y486) TaxID=1055687 RepID=G0TYS0_TRYVY|nr:hypothetical protein TVY486_0704530 [Trypanosoma vivax Y486]
MVCDFVIDLFWIRQWPISKKEQGKSYAQAWKCRNIKKEGCAVWRVGLLITQLQDLGRESNGADVCCCCFCITRWSHLSFFLFNASETSYSDMKNMRMESGYQCS